MKRTMTRRKNMKNVIPKKRPEQYLWENLPNKIKRKAVKKLFAAYKIESVRLRSFSTSKPAVDKKRVLQQKLFHENSDSINAYVVLSSKEEANEALELNGFEYQGRLLRVDISGNHNKRDPSRCIFVGNLRSDVKDDDVHKLFSECGDIEYVRIIRDNLTRVGKGLT
eukprot:UN01692